MSTYRQIIPSDKDYNIYLTWLSQTGGIRNWFFSHTDGEKLENVSNFEVETLTDIRSIPDMKRTTYVIVTRFLNSDDYDYVASILKSNRIYQVLTDGSQIPVSIKAQKIKRSNKDKSFELGFQVSLQEENILNV